MNGRHYSKPSYGQALRYGPMTNISKANIRTEPPLVNGVVEIDRVREDPKQNITTYILNERGLKVGDITITDFGLDIDSSFLHGNLTLPPSEEDPDRLTGKLLLEGSG
jgi:hypothetical protein